MTSFCGRAQKKKKKKALSTLSHLPRTARSFSRNFFRCVSPVFFLFCSFSLVLYVCLLFVACFFYAAEDVIHLLPACGQRRPVSSSYTGCVFVHPPRARRRRGSSFEMLTRNEHSGTGDYKEKERKRKKNIRGKQPLGGARSSAKIVTCYTFRCEENKL